MSSNWCDPVVHNIFRYLTKVPTAAWDYFNGTGVMFTRSIMNISSIFILCILMNDSNNCLIEKKAHRNKNVTSESMVILCAGRLSLMMCIILKLMS